MIADAVWSERWVKMRYKRNFQIVSRRVQPLGLVLKGGVWYLVAQAGQQARTYRVSNILDLSVTAEPFDRPKDFDLARFWTAASRAYEVGIYRGNAVLLISPRGMAELASLGSTVAQSAAESAGAPDAKGWVRVVIPIESSERATADMIRLGADVEVLAPPALRRKIAAVARDVVALYRKRKTARAR